MRPAAFQIEGVKIASVNPPMKELAREHLNRYRTMPNLLTLLRICLAPFLVAAILGNRFALSRAILQ